MDLFENYCNNCFVQQRKLRNINETKLSMKKMRDILKIIIPDLDFHSKYPLFLCDNCCNKFIELYRFRDISSKNLVSLKYRCLTVKSLLETSNCGNTDVKNAIKNLISDADRQTKKFISEKYNIGNINKYEINKSSDNYVMETEMKREKSDGKSVEVRRKNQVEEKEKSSENDQNESDGNFEEISVKCIKQENGEKLLEGENDNILAQQYISSKNIGSLLTEEHHGDISNLFELHIESNPTSVFISQDTDVIKCKYCDMAYTKKSFYIKHLRKTHANLLTEEDHLEDISNLSDTEINSNPTTIFINHLADVYKCKYCDMAYAMKSLYERHLRRSHGIVLPYLPENNYNHPNNSHSTTDIRKTKSDSNSNFSLLNSRSFETTVKESKTVYECQYCDMAYSVKSFCDQHVKLVHQFGPHCSSSGVIAPSTAKKPRN